MKEYNFEYSNQRFTLKLALIAYSVFFALIFLAIYAKGFTAPWLTVVIIIAIPVFICWMNWKRIRTYGEASINNTFVDLKLKYFNGRVEYQNIKSFMVNVYNGGIMLKLKLNDGRRVRIVANNNSCNSEQFTLFCDNLETVLEKFQIEKGIEITREKSLFERTGMLIFLIILSLTVISTIVLGIINKKNLTSTILTIGVITSLWATYYNTKRRRKLRANKME